MAGGGGGGGGGWGGGGNGLIVFIALKGHSITNIVICWCQYRVAAVKCLPVLQCSVIYISWSF